MKDPRWYINTPSYEGNPTDAWKQLDLKKAAKELLEDAVVKYHKKSRFQRSGLPKEFLESAQRSGTLRDQIGALVTIVEEAPLYKLKELTSLIDQLEKKSKRVMLLIFPALKDLFINILLPDRYLVHFSQRNFHFDTLTKRHLIFAIFESHLKELYQRYLLCLEELSQDPLEYPRNMALKLARELIERKPEGERFLLALIINKMGDPSKNIASKSGYFLHQILFRHPHMKSFIAREVMQFCVRPNLPLRAKQYALNFLSLLHFTSKEDPNFLQSLLTFYLSEFHEFVREKWKQDKSASTDNYSKPISYILQGIKRCIFFLEEEELNDKLKTELSSIFQIAKSDTDSDWLVAVELLFFMLRKVDVKGFEGCGKVLYQRIFDSLHLSVQKQERFLKIISESLKSDNVVDRVCAMTKRLFQAALESNACFAAACLLSVYQDNSLSELKGILSSFVRFPEQGTISLREDDSKNKSIEYNGYVMNPLKANAAMSCFWELDLLSHHFHPTVSIFASKVLDVCETPAYSGNALKDFSLHSFLERFSQRKPKAGVVESLKGSSILGSSQILDRNNVDEFVEDQVTLATLVSEIGDRKLDRASKRKRRMMKQEERDDDDDDDDLDEEFEQEVRRKFGNSLDMDDMSIEEIDEEEEKEEEEEEDDDVIVKEVHSLMKEPIDDLFDSSLERYPENRKNYKKQKRHSVFAPAEEYEVEIP
ncbi:CCAAT/enhancer-binding protein zeta [Galdieria sulphuraria]|nr:CCAAT/enhancer-binding protein zeta [Galdieria sulphuraria]